MKTPNQNSFRSLSAGFSLFCSLLAFNANAALTFYDPQGTAGSAEVNGVWESNVWTSAAAGTASPVAWVEGQTPGFASTVGPSNQTYVVTMNLNHTVGGIFNGLTGPEGGNVTITGSGILTIPVNAGSASGFYTGNAVNFTTILNSITGPGILENESSGGLYLYGSNSYTGGTLLGTSAGLNINNNHSLGTGLITWDVGTVVLASVGSDGPSGNVGTTGPITITNSMKATNGTLIFANDAGFPVTFSGPVALQTGTSSINIKDAPMPGNAVTFSGVISGSAAVTKNGLGALVFAGANTYTGNTTITNGVLQLGANGGIPSGSGKGNLIITNAATASTLDVNGFSGSVNGLLGNGTVDNTAATPGTLTVGNNNVSSTYVGSITSTGAPLNLTKAGTGTLTLNTLALGYTGNTTVNAGSVVLTNGAPLPNTPVTVATGATLDLGSTAQSISALSGGGTITNNSSSGISLFGGTNGTNFPSYSCFFGKIDQGSLTKAGAGVMSLRNTNLYNINFSYQSGVLSVGAVTNCLPPAYSLNVPSSGLFQLDAAYQTVSALNGSSGAAINLGGGTLNVNATSASFYGGTIQNSELITNSTAAGHGLRGYYYDNIDFSGLDTVRDDATVNFTNFALAGLPTPPYPKTNFISIRWLGQILTTVAGTYTFTGTSDDGQRLWINGTNIIDDWASQSATAKSGSIALAANTRYDIVYEYMNVTVPASVKLAWTPPGDTVSMVIPTDYLFLPGAGTLVVGGISQVTLAASNSYTGGTTVASGGFLEASADGALGKGNVYVNSGGVLELDSGSANTYIAPTGDLVINGSGTQVSLNYSGTDTIHAFSTNGGATYLPAGTYGSSSSGAAHQLPLFSASGVLNVTAIPASVLLTSSGGSTSYGSSVTFTSTVSGSGPTPTGTVTVYDGLSAIGMATLSGGVATLTVSDLLATTSPHFISAIYSGDSVYTAATSSPLTQTVAPLTISPGTLAVSNRVYDTTATASLALATTTVVGVLPGDTNNVRIGSGTAVFSDKGAAVGKTVTITGLTLSGSLSGNYSLSPNSGTGTANITTKPIAITNVTANTRPYDTTTNVSLNSGSATLVTVLGSDNVTINSAGATGSVASAAPGAGKAVTVTGYALAGTDATNYSLTAQPSGVTATITQASTTNVLISSANPSGIGANVTFTSTVTAVAPGAGVPTGSVTFQTNGFLFNIVTLTNGVTAISTSNLTTGPNSIFAAYGGDANFIGSSNTINQIVGNASPGLLTISRIGTSTVLTWSNSFTLQSSVVVNGTNSGFADVPGPVLTGPYTNTNTAPVLFYRLRQ